MNIISSLWSVDITVILRWTERRWHGGESAGERCSRVAGYDRLTVGLDLHWVEYWLPHTSLLVPSQLWPAPLHQLWQLTAVASHGPASRLLCSAEIQSGKIILSFIDWQLSFTARIKMKTSTILSIQSRIKFRFLINDFCICWLAGRVYNGLERRPRWQNLYPLETRRQGSSHTRDLRRKSTAHLLYLVASLTTSQLII